VNTRGSQDEPEEPDTVDASTATEGPDGRTRPRASVVWPLVFLAPLAWAVLVLFHPMGDESGPFESVRPVVNRWLVVHFGQLFLTPFLVLAVWRLLDGVSSAGGDGEPVRRRRLGDLLQRVRRSPRNRHGSSYPLRRWLGRV
jgi:hypothetical protein